MDPVTASRYFSITRLCNAGLATAGVMTLHNGLPRRRQQFPH